MSLSYRYALSLALFASMLLGLALFCGCEKESAATSKAIRPVKTMTLDAAAATIRRNYPGKVDAAERATISFRVGGTLEALPIQEGQEVAKDELLARLDRKDYLVALSNAEAQLGQAVAQRDLAQAEYKRLTDVNARDPGAIAAAEIDKKRETYNAAEAQVNQLKTQVEDAENQLDYAELKAPFAGVVAVKFVENFEKVEPKQPVVLLEDISHIEVIVNVPENVVQRIQRDKDGKMVRQEGSKAVAVFESLPDEEYEMEIKEFSTEADPDTQTYKVTLEMPAPLGVSLFPGMSCTVVHYFPVSTEGEVETFEVPAGAVLDDAGKHFVWQVDGDGAVHRREVTVGELVGDRIQVTSGLELGLTIATAGVHVLREGEKVRPIGSDIKSQLK